MSNTTNLVSLPVCECGYVFKEPILLKYDYMELDNFIFKIPIIEPNKCPNCNKKIESIMFGSDVVKTDDKNTKTNIYKIADHYGKDPQLSMLQEECAELIQAVSKYNRTGNFDKIIEEISDVEVMIEQIKYLFNCSDNVEKVKEEKIKRQLERIKRNETNI